MQSNNIFCRIKADQPSAKPVKVYKPKSFQELVRLQRPEITRMQQPTQPPPEKYIHQVLAEKAAQRAQSARMEKSRETAIREPQSELPFYVPVFFYFGFQADFSHD